MSDDNTKSPEKKGKAGGTSVDEQFKFLIACIRHSNNGKINFDEVAKECTIISKGAAAKRYERLMKAHDIHPQAPPNPRDASVASAKKLKAANAKESKTGSAKAANAAAAKKRKALEADSAPNNEEDDEEPSQAAKKKKFKKEVKSEPKIEAETEEAGVKAEDNEESPGASSIAQYDGSFDMAPVETKSVVTIKDEPALVVKTEPTMEATNLGDQPNSAIFKIEDESAFDEFLEPLDKPASFLSGPCSGKESIVIAD
ncbi:MAG: hypothetical protein Q9166_004879 [cf. Caloplaca sp. 2 TL-2023]